MLQQALKIKGIHPGYLIGRELKKRQLSRGPFALSLQEYPQTLGAIINGHRKMNTKLSLKIEKEFGWEEGLLMSLQVFYDIKQEKKAKKKTKIPIVRRILFWDTDFDSINWASQKNAIMKRVFERGSVKEKQAIREFYAKNPI